MKPSSKIKLVNDVRDELLEEVKHTANDLSESINKSLDDFAETMEHASYVFALKKAVKWILHGMSDSDEEKLDGFEDVSYLFQLEYIREKFHDVDPLFTCGCNDKRCYRTESSLDLPTPPGDRAPDGFYYCIDCGSDRSHDRIPHKYYDGDGDEGYVKPEFDVEGHYDETV
tara:strand:+ start:3348 stop:3860 length:513 start_codon:yes stop_codon:yes gene_type:complete